MNSMVSKKTLLKEFTAEIEKLKSELIATRQRNGVYLSNQAYEDITVESESRRILSEEQKAKIETMEANLRNKIQELFSLTNNFAMLKRDNEATKQQIDEINDVLEKTEMILANTNQNLADETKLRKAHQLTEEQLSVKGSELISTLDKTVKDVNGLYAKIRRKSDIQLLNRSNWESSQAQVIDITQLVESRVIDFQEQHHEHLQCLSTKMQNYFQKEFKEIITGQKAMEQKLLEFQKSKSEVISQSSEARDEMNDVLEEIKVLREDVKAKVGEGLQGLSSAAARISQEVVRELEEFNSKVSPVDYV